MNTACAELLERYHSQHPIFPSPLVTAGYFCADQPNADRCATLIDLGIKTASCSMAYWYEQNLEPWPEVGQLHIVTHWNGEPVCIIEITKITLCRFVDVSAEFAYAEGEGDRTLRHWRLAHRKFFKKECQSLGIEFSEQACLVLERFERVFG